MATYFCKSSAAGGSDSNSGTELSPWLSAEHAIEDGGVTGGDTLFVADGADTFKSGTDGRIICPATSGIISVVGYNNVVANLHVGSIGLFYPPQGGELHLGKLKVTNPDGTGGGGQGIFSCYQERQIICTDCEFDGDDKELRVAVFLGTASGVRRITFERCNIHNFGPLGSPLFRQDSSGVTAEVIARASLFYDCRAMAGGVNPMAVSLTNCTTVNTAAETTDHADSYLGIKNCIQKTATFGAGNSVAFLSIGDALYGAGITDPTVFEYNNNIVYFEGDQSGIQYQLAVDANYLIPINKTNWFINPDFTNEGSDDYSLSSTSKVSARGDSAILPDTDINGDAWTGADVGAFKNPSATRYNPALVGKAAFVGDSIMDGSSASVGYRCFDVFEDLSGFDTVTDGTVAIGGTRAECSRYLIDYTIFNHLTDTIFLSCGTNNINAGTLKPTGITARTLADQIILNMQIIEDRGALPIWLGIGSQIGDPPDNDFTQDVNGYVEDACLQYGWHYTNWYEYMVEANPSDWATTYYADLTTDVHPNNAGHGKIAEEALYAWLESEPMIRPCVAVPVRCKPARCWPVRCR